MSHSETSRRLKYRSSCVLFTNVEKFSVSHKVYYNHSHLIMTTPPWTVFARLPASSRLAIFLWLGIIASLTTVITKPAETYADLLKLFHSFLSNKPLIKKTDWSGAVLSVWQWLAVKPINLWKLWIRYCLLHSCYSCQHIYHILCFGVSLCNLDLIRPTAVTSCI